MRAFVLGFLERTVTKLWALSCAGWHLHSRAECKGQNERQICVFMCFLKYVFAVFTNQ